MWISVPTDCSSKGLCCLYLQAVWHKYFSVLSVVHFRILQTVLILLLQNVGNSQREYEKLVVAFSVKNQLRYKGNLGMYIFRLNCPTCT